MMVLRHIPRPVFRSCRSDPHHRLPHNPYGSKPWGCWFLQPLRSDRFGNREYFNPRRAAPRCGVTARRDRGLDRSDRDRDGGLAAYNASNVLRAVTTVGQVGAIAVLPSRCCSTAGGPSASERAQSKLSSRLPSTRSPPSGWLVS